MRIFKKLIILLLLVYIGICALVYYKQKSMLFPSDSVQPVSAYWRPTAGDSATQTFINSSCGKIHAVIWKIRHAKGTIMMFHGNGESVASINDYAYAFTDLGYNLMTWDYAGYGQSTDCWLSQTELLNDAESAYQWLATQESAERIVIFGYSIGTGIAAYTASQHPQHDVYLVAAYDSLLNVAKERVSNLLPVSIIMRYPLPASVWIKKISGHIHIMHGLQDTLILPSRAGALFSEARNNTDIEYVADAGHGDENLYHYRNAWMKRHLIKDSLGIEGQNEQPISIIK